MINEFQFQNLGSMVLLTPLTDKAKDWLNENVFFESWQVYGDEGILIEHRLGNDIFEAISNLTD